MKQEVAYEVPRSVWQWATDAFDDRTCGYIWKVILIRQLYRTKLRRTALRAGILLGLLTVFAGKFFGGASQATGVVAYALTIVTMCYLIVGMFNLRRINLEAVDIYATDWATWLKIGDALDPLLRAVRRGDPMVSVLVTFEYPDAK